MISFLLALLLGVAAAAENRWLDQSHDVFLDRDLNRGVTLFREFPVFWWNFLVIESDRAPSELCAEWMPGLSASLRKWSCGLEPQDLMGLTAEWRRDLPLRIPYPGEAAVRVQAERTLARAAMPLPRSMLEILRADPFDVLGDLRHRLEARPAFKVPTVAGTVRDDRGRLWIPVQFDFPPNNSTRTADFRQQLERACESHLGCRSVAIFGPHGSTLENETRIRGDIGVVSVVGTIALIVVGLFVLFTRRYRLAGLIPILLLGLGLATLVTVVVFGKIHGITLAFGPGIVGLALDYGVHAVFLDPRSKSTWRSNLAGLLTTLVILVILMFSAIPLLQQLMVFSSVGLIISFLLFYVVLNRWPKFFETRPYAFSPRDWAVGEWLAMALLLCGPLLFARPLELGIQGLNFESSATREMREWFGRHATNLSPYWIAEDDIDPLSSAVRTRDWARQNNLAYEGPAAFLPARDEQIAHLATWEEACRNGLFAFDNRAQKFFAPFTGNLKCSGLRHLRADAPDYTRDFRARDQWVSLIFPRDAGEVAKVKAQFPQASTPREILSSFPRIFMKELAWMIPVSLLLALIFLWRHFRKVAFTALSVVPFLTGVGCYALASFGFSLPLSFISLIGLLMVFGFSLDYGIFVVDLLRGREDTRFGVWSALSVCSVGAVAGFAPLVFAGHPVLRDLGHALLWGSVGTYIGTFWGIPGIYRRRFA